MKNAKRSTDRCGLLPTTTTVMVVQTTCGVYRGRNFFFFSPFFRYHPGPEIMRYNRRTLSEGTICGKYYEMTARGTQRNMLLPRPNISHFDDSCDVLFTAIIILRFYSPPLPSTNPFRFYIFGSLLRAASARLWETIKKKKKKSREIVQVLVRYTRTLIGKIVLFGKTAPRACGTHKNRQYQYRKLYVQPYINISLVKCSGKLCISIFERIYFT